MTTHSLYINSHCLSFPLPLFGLFLRLDRVFVPQPPSFIPRFPPPTPRSGPLPILFASLFHCRVLLYMHPACLRSGPCNSLPFFLISSVYPFFPPFFLFLLCFLLPHSSPLPVFFLPLPSPPSPLNPYQFSLFPDFSNTSFFPPNVNFDFSVCLFSLFPISSVYLRGVPRLNPLLGFSPLCVLAWQVVPFPPPSAMPMAQRCFPSSTGGQ